MPKKNLATTKTKVNVPVPKLPKGRKTIPKVLCVCMYKGLPTNEGGRIQQDDGNWYKCVNDTNNGIWVRD
jgi:hypothetical protein